MAWTGNRGEWAEAYVFLKLLACGKLYAANIDLSQSSDVFYPIKKIYKEDGKGNRYSYITGEVIEIHLNDLCVRTITTSEVDSIANTILHSIQGAGTRTFEVPNAEMFLRSIYVDRICEAPTHKTDIVLQLHDLHTGMLLESGFSIKSDFASKATLLNSSEATNFIFKIHGYNDQQMEITNSIVGKTKVIDRITHILNNSDKLTFVGTNSQVANNNLQMIDTMMPKIISEALKYYYCEQIGSCVDVSSVLDSRDPLQLSIPGIYRYKMKKLLCATALGLMIGRPWNGIEDANGGYIVVKHNGEIATIHIHDRGFFEDYLLSNTKLEHGSTDKHNYCNVYKEYNEYYIKLNLAIRFV